ncbi:MAG: methylated-DNA--[protein]-cysteine S-methyltransferase [Desulfobacterales bacterium]|nr:methylated-DNA--[protein]-cysteine S-methyltransferase [Desulfobacterales bacterium]MDH3877035.1 methylated-DNA--[protein]-cysteine S-methyltransferase [Desulfobacterales bacterium]
MQTYTACYRSEIGPFEIVGNQKGILTISFNKAPSVINRNLPACLQECMQQMDEYFKGQRRKFNVPLLLKGTDFQKAVWRQLQKIPFGQTASYGDVARAVGSPRAFRAVGNANNKNPIPLIIPCHRVIGSDGKLVGFGGGIWRKEWLLEHEQSPLL